MALSLRLRRSLTLSSSLLKDRHFSSISSSPPPLSPPKPRAPIIGNPSSRPHFLIQAQSFRSSPVSFNRRFNDEKEIGPDDILFEGCDYNHWLITIDFPRDPESAPTREQMIDTYVQTAAQVFGSVEEAKKRIYACSTTTYHGFQCICDEATSEKFRGLPGVVFILPDSYIDPVNKEYGGDKYENGVITPRPPPIAYGRQGRYGDRNRNYDQPRYNRPGSTQEGRAYGPPQQEGRNYSPPPQDGRNYSPPPQAGRDFGPPPQDGRGFAPHPRTGGHRTGGALDPHLKTGGALGPHPRMGGALGPHRRTGGALAPHHRTEEVMLKVNREIKCLPIRVVFTKDKKEIFLHKNRGISLKDQLMLETIGMDQVSIMDQVPVVLLKDNGRQNIEVQMAI